MIFRIVLLLIIPIILQAASGATPTLLPTESSRPTKPASVITSTDLSRIQPYEGIVINGANTGDQFGRCVGRAGDFNGDGYDDIIVGAFMAYSGAGVSYVIFGNGNHSAILNVGQLQIHEGFFIKGEINGDSSGFCVSGAGDVNNDGYDDVIIGAYGANSVAGKSYIIFGKPFGWTNIFLSTLTMPVGYSIFGPTGSFRSGYSVSSAGDINGDGYGDVIIGAYFANSLQGMVFVIFGKASNFTDIHLGNLDLHQGFSITGISSSDQTGRAVSGAGDINGDGLDDILIGANSVNSGSGAVYIIFGKRSNYTNIHLAALSLSEGFKISGGPSNYLGRAVGKAGDINNDGYDDVLLGSPQYPTSAPGFTCVLFGRPTGFTNIYLPNMTLEEGFTLRGTDSYGNVGYSVGHLDDVNGDGYPDYIIGSQYAKSFILFGRKDGYQNIVLSNLNPSIGFSVLDVGSTGSGISVSGIGDFNKDGYSDYLIGGPGAKSSTGVAYVLYGNQYQTYYPTGNPTSQPSDQPTTRPTARPNSQPTSFPSIQPSVLPTSQPSMQPSTHPTERPTYWISNTKTNSVVNGGAEFGTVGWTGITTDDHHGWIITSNAHSGNHGFLILCTSSCSPIRQSLVLSISSYYSASLWLLSGVNLNLNLKIDNQTVISLVHSQTSGSWRRYHGGFVALNSTAVLQLSTTLYSATDFALVDDIAISLTMPTSQPTGQPSSLPIADPSSLPSAVPSHRPSTQPTCSPSNPSSQPSCRPTMIPSETPSGQPSNEPSSQPSSQPTMQPSSFPSSQPSTKPSRQPSNTPTSQPTGQPSGQPVTAPTSQPSAPPTDLPSSSPSSVPSMQPTTAPSSQPTDYLTLVPTAQPSNVPSSQPTDRPTNPPISFPSSRPSNQPSAIPIVLPSYQPSSPPSAFPSCIPTSEPSAIPSVLPSYQPSSQPSTEPSAAPSAQPSGHPAAVPSAEPTLTPFSQPTSGPTTEPLSEPTSFPSIQPSSLPSIAPASLPTSIPSISSSLSTSQPTNRPSVAPSNNPTILLSSEPSDQPTRHPSVSLASFPSSQPSSFPTIMPRTFPSNPPINLPSGQPSSQPTNQPSVNPTTQPISRPSFKPLAEPTRQPSSQPTGQPSTEPSSKPSFKPTMQPTILMVPGKTQKPSRIPSFRPSAIPTEQPTSNPTRVSISVRSDIPFSNFKVSMNILGIQSKSSSALHDVSIKTSDLIGTNSIILGSRGYSSDIYLDQRANGKFYSVNHPAAFSFDSAIRAITPIDDINGDGFRDLLLGDPFQSKAYLFLGNNKGFVDMNIKATILGENSYDYFGWSVDSARDFNGDGLDDLIISATGSGKVYLLYNKPSGFDDIKVDSLNDTDGFILQGKQGAATGLAVAGIGDINNDGYADVAISAIFKDKSLIYVIFGFMSNHSSVNNVLDLASLTAKQGLTINAPLFTGLSLSHLGDINRDGYDDFAIGSLPYLGGYQQQVTFIIYGSAALNNQSSLDVNHLQPSEGFRIFGGGLIVAGPGDMNNDGFNDVLVTNYPNWHGKPASYLCIYPRNNTTPPTLLPSALPSSTPSSSPTSLPTLLSSALPTALTGDYSSSLPTVSQSRPSLHLSPSGPSQPPTLQPTTNTRRPRVPPSPRPTISPSNIQTISPSIQPSPVPTQSPSNRPFPFHTRAPSSSRSPSSFPSSYPTYSENTSKKQYQQENIHVQGTYLEDCHNKFLIITASGMTTISCEGSPIIYRIKPIPEASLTLLTFNTKADSLSFIDFPFLQSIADLSYTTNPLTIHLPDDQQILLLSHSNLNNFHSKNFLFQENNNLSPATSFDFFDMNTIISFVIAGSLFALVFLLYFEPININRLYSYWSLKKHSVSSWQWENREQNDGNEEEDDDDEEDDDCSLSFNMSSDSLDDAADGDEDHDDHSIGSIIARNDGCSSGDSFSFPSVSSDDRNQADQSDAMDSEDWNSLESDSSNELWVGREYSLNQSKLDHEDDWN